MTPTAAAVPRSTEGLTLPENASLPTRLRVGWRALKVLQGDEGNPIAVPLLNVCLDGGVYEALARELMQTGEGRALLTERPSLQKRDLDLEALLRLPRGTAGHEFARYFQDNGISPFETPFEARNDVEYLAVRYRETHDLAHVLTGYGIDVVGEMEVQAFMLGNLGLRSAALILTFAQVNVVSKLEGVTLRQYARRVWAAWRRGKRSQQLIRVRYERLWETPVVELRTRLGMA